MKAREDTMTKSILITGHTGNLGSACVEYFKSKDWNVTSISRSNGVDLSNHEQIERYLGAYRGPTFDVILMTHGIVDSIRIDKMQGEDWNKIIDNNLLSSLMLTSYLLRLDGFLSENALIVYCSSIQADLPRAGRYLYGLSKLGLELLAKSVHVEHSPKIRSIALRLGQMEKLMAGRTFSDEERKSIENYTPLPWVNCTDVAKLVECLYEQKSMSGTVVNVDSGHNLSVWPK